MKRLIRESFAAAALGGGGTVLVVGLASMFLANRLWLADLLVNFQVHYLVTLLLCLFLLVISRRQLTAAAFLLGTLILAIPVIPYAKLPFGNQPAAEPVANERVYRILSYNVLQTNRRTRDVADYIADQRLDFVLLLETDKPWAEEMDFELRDHFPHRFEEPQSDYQGLVFYSKLPWKSARILTEFDDPTLEVVFDLAEGRLTLIGIHPLPPIRPPAADRRNVLLKQLADYVATLRESVLLIGDFNITPWSPHFRGLLEAGELTDSGSGRGIQNTWYRYPVLLAGLPIDHAVSRNLEVLDRFIGPPIGSDHRPLLMDFLVRPNGFPEAYPLDPASSGTAQ